jgi:undecaprenyl-diphosphatase
MLDVSLFIETFSFLLEPFPISSSGHAYLLRTLISCFSNIDVQTPPSYYAYLMHGPTALVLACFFWSPWLDVIKNKSVHFVMHLMAAGIVAVSMTALLYGIFSYTSTSWWPLWLGFFISACALWSLKKCPARAINNPFSYSSAAGLGLVQGIALLPGISRFGTTFVAARWLKFSSRDAFIYSFLIEFPISIAGFLKGVYKMQGAHVNMMEILNPPLCFSILIAMGGAYAGFYAVQKIVDQQSLWVFSIYLCVLSWLSIIITAVC